jgi:putative RNA 2'-phosphotransferase
MELKKRQHVHLSSDIEIALKVGKRHGKPIVLVVDSGQMQQDGYEFFISENQVWLTDVAPTEYLEIMR